jgi:membrane protease YdiL (CAAX protease family)
MSLRLDLPTGDDLTFRPILHMIGQTIDWRRTVVTLGTFTFVLELWRLLGALSFYQRWIGSYPDTIQTVVWKFLQVLVVIPAVAISYRAGASFAFHELGLSQSRRLALLFALVVTLPSVLLRFAVAGAKPQLNAATLLMSAVASPLSEELLFRGYLFGQLYRRAGWPFWVAALANAVPFVAGHFYQLSGNGWEFVVSLAEVLVLVGVSALFAAWVYVRWEYNLWVLIFIHALLNLYSTIFATSETSGSGWVDNVAWLVTLTLVVVGTIYRKRIPLMLHK